MEELVARHFPYLTITMWIWSRGDRAWLAEKEVMIVVSGSFGRSLLSRLFKRVLLQA
jgi:hypothetical protein